MLIERKKLPIGTKFNRWTVIGDAFKEGKRLVIPVRCDCGKERVILKGGLMNNLSQSCGCLMKEVNGAKKLRHGLSRDPVYKVWTAMKQRCDNPDAQKYADYGGRGISYAPQWADFAVFIRDVGDRPSDDAELDRIDNAGNYEPGNVRWTTRKVNCNNTRQCQYLTYQDRTQTLTEWADELGISQSTLSSRINGYGWSTERALSTPVRHSNRAY